MADAETAIVAKDAVAIEDRQAGKLDREAFAALLHRPGDAKPAPGLAARQGERDLAPGIKRKKTLENFRAPRGRPLASRSSGTARKHGFRLPWTMIAYQPASGRPNIGLETSG
jgi:hypothetical protein